MSDSPFDTATPAGALLAGLAERFPGAGFATSLGDPVVRLAREDLAAFAGAARDSGLDTFIDLCAVDYLSRPEGRFEVVVHLLSLEARLRLRIQAAVPGDDPRVPSLTAVFPGANFYEREAYHRIAQRGGEPGPRETLRQTGEQGPGGSRGVEGGFAHRTISPERILSWRVRMPCISDCGPGGQPGT